MQDYGTWSKITVYVPPLVRKKTAWTLFCHKVLPTFSKYVEVKRSMKQFWTLLRQIKNILSMSCKRSRICALVWRIAQKKRLNVLFVVICLEPQFQITKSGEFNGLEVIEYQTHLFEALASERLASGHCGENERDGERQGVLCRLP